MKILDVPSIVINIQHMEFVEAKRVSFDDVVNLKSI